MNKLQTILLFVCCFVLCSCNDENETLDRPIEFAKLDYAIRNGESVDIPFTNGGGEYELTATNPEVLSKYYIDAKTRHLNITPSKAGKSSLIINDVKTGKHITLNFTAFDHFQMVFRIDKIDGKNINEYFKTGDEIKFSNEGVNDKSIKIFRRKKGASEEFEIVANGMFEIIRSDTNIYTMDIALHSKVNEELVSFEYLMFGEGAYIELFNRYFNYNWPQTIASSDSQPIEHCKLRLFDPYNECEIPCTLLTTTTR